MFPNEQFIIVLSLNKGFKHIPEFSEVVRERKDQMIS